MRVGALPDITPVCLDRDSTESVETTTLGLAEVPHDDGRAAKVARLALVRPGITTAATLAHERTLPVATGLRELIPGTGLQRGSTVVAHGVGATSFSLAVSAEAVRQGSFLAVVAPRSFSLAACLDFDIPLRRVVQFVLPESGQLSTSWAQLVAAIIEGFDLVLVADRRRVTASQARQLVARTRERGSVLVRSGGPAWPDAADLRFDLREPQWQGVGPGHGHLRSRTLAVQVAGRRSHGRQRGAGSGSRVQHLLLPGRTQGAETIGQSEQSDQSGLPEIDERTETLAPSNQPGSITSPTHIGSYRSGDRAVGERFAGSDIDHLLNANANANANDHDTGDDSQNNGPSRAFGATA